jgi:nucleoid DNA-binding protein
VKKSDIIRNLVNRYPTIPPYQVELIVNDFLELVSATLQQGEDVGINSFGKFVVRDRGESRRRNPKTGALLVVPPKRGVLFHPSVVLRRMLNEEE